MTYVACPLPEPLIVYAQVAGRLWVQAALYMEPYIIALRGLFRYPCLILYHCSERQL